jgi:undecaprenyl-diphosphatase
MFTWLVNANLHKAFTTTSRYFSKSGDGYLYVFTIALLFLTEGAQSTVLKTIFCAFLLERPIYFVLKNSFKRNRPEAALANFRSTIKPSDQFSFPSGHSSAAFMMATLLGYFFPAFIAPLYVWAASVACSRVVLGVHFPTDILVGSVLGISIALVSLGYII